MEAKFKDMEENTIEGISRRRRKDVLVCVQDVAVNKKFLSQFEYG